LIGAHPEVINSSGTRIASFDGLTEALWADDSKHLCMLERAADGYDRLLLIDVSQPQLHGSFASLPKAVADMSQIAVLSCSIGPMVAAVGYRAEAQVPSGGAAPLVVEVVVVSFATHAREFSLDLRSTGGSQPGLVVVSHDSRYIAVNHADGAILEELKTGASAIHLPGYNVIVFSWLGDRVVAHSSSSGHGTALVWQTTRVIWEGKGPVADAEARPDQNDDILVAVDNGTGGGQDLIVVRRDGSSMTMVRNVELIH
jgi:hypothetical protein